MCVEPEELMKHQDVVKNEAPENPMPQAQLIKLPNKCLDFVFDKCAEYLACDAATPNDTENLL